MQIQPDSVKLVDAEPLPDSIMWRIQDTRTEVNFDASNQGILTRSVAPDAASPQGGSGTLI